MIEIAICDDQAEFAMQFSDSIKKICAEEFTDSEDVHICGIFSSAEQVLGALSQKRIDILFLDIELEGMSGFELAEIVHQNYPETILMFVSSYERLVYVSFRFSPFRFLRKAMLSEELKGALRDAIDLKMSKEKTVQLKTSDGIVHIPLSEIVYLESSANYVLVFRDGEREPYKVRGPLSGFSPELLGEPFFVRIHHAFIINLEKIKRVGPKSVVMMNNNITLPISQKKKKEFDSAYLTFVKRRLIH